MRIRKIIQIGLSAILSVSILHGCTNEVDKQLQDIVLHELVTDKVNENKAIERWGGHINSYFRGEENLLRSLEIGRIFLAEELKVNLDNYATGYDRYKDAALRDIAESIGLPKVKDVKTLHETESEVVLEASLPRYEGRIRIKLFRDFTYEILEFEYKNRYAEVFRHLGKKADELREEYPAQDFSKVEFTKASDVVYDALVHEALEDYVAIGYISDDTRDTDSPFAIQQKRLINSGEATFPNKYIKTSDGATSFTDFTRNNKILGPDKYERDPFIYMIAKSVRYPVLGEVITREEINLGPISGNKKFTRTEYNIDNYFYDVYFENGEGFEDFESINRTAVIEEHKSGNANLVKLDNPSYPRLLEFYNEIPVGSI